MEETFGPVIGIMKVESDEEALGLMNESPYGLASLRIISDRNPGSEVYSCIDCIHLDIAYRSHVPRSVQHFCRRSRVRNGLPQSCGRARACTALVRMERFWAGRELVINGLRSIDQDEKCLHACCIIVNQRVFFMRGNTTVMSSCFQPRLVILRIHPRHVFCSL